MYTKLMIQSTFLAANSTAKFVVLPIEGCIKTQHFQRVRSRRKFVLWLIYALVFLPIQLLDVYYNIIKEISSIGGKSDLTYLFFNLFCASVATTGCVLNFHLATRTSILLQAMNQALIVDRYLQSTLSK